MPKAITGVFHHPILTQHSWDVIGNKLKNFGKVIEQLSRLPGVVIYDEEPISEELLLKVHTPRMLEEVKNYSGYHGALYCADGCVKAAEKVWSGKIQNAFITLSCCHHAGPDHFWGGCTVSGCGPMVANLRQKFGVRRFAILDTDSHHGDGVRAIFKGDRDVLHVCFCSTDAVEDGGTKIDIDAGWRTTDKEYLNKVRQHFIPKVAEFKPDLIFHLLGHDTARGDYGDRGLSKEFFPQLVRLVKETADTLCQGRYVVGIGGGHRADIAEYIALKSVPILAEIET